MIIELDLIREYMAHQQRFQFFGHWDVTGLVEPVIFNLCYMDLMLIL